MSLALQQREFMAQILDEERALPPGWSDRMAAGLAVYRNAYRARLVEALRETFPRTAQCVGEEAFRAAAAHHLIIHPPHGWTLDLAGEGFERTLAELFANDPEVPELAWLEWAMHRAFVAANAAPLGTEGFALATAGFGEEQWAQLRLGFVPSLALRPACSDCAALWRALAAGEQPPVRLALAAPGCCIVWREGLSPVFRLASEAEGACLALMHEGGAFAAMCEHLAGLMGDEAAVGEAGAMLGRWLADGLVAIAPA